MALRTFFVCDISSLGFAVVPLLALKQKLNKMVVIFSSHWHMCQKALGLEAEVTPISIG